MASKYFATLLKPSQIVGVDFKMCRAQERLLHTTPVVCKVTSGKVKISIKRNKPVTYENSLSPPHIAHRKSWNSWNTSTLEGGLRPAETTIEDLFIRKFMQGTFPNAILSKVIIKRQHNIIRIAAILSSVLTQRQLCFLVGYTETLLGFWLQCIVKLELQVLDDPKKLIFKYI